MDLDPNRVGAFDPRVSRRQPTSLARPYLNWLFRGIRPPWVFRWHHAYLAFVERVEGHRPPTEFHVRWATSTDMELMATVRAKTAMFEKLFARQQRCVLGFVGDEPVSMNWFDPVANHVSKDNCFSFDAGPNGRWSHSTFVRPEYRRRRLYGAHLARTLELLRSEGVDGVWCGMFVDDKRSLAAHVRIGYQIMFRLRTLRVAGATLHAVTNVSNGRTTLHLGQWHGRAPTVGIDG